ncbi:ankyrin repeat domain-containing protein 65-like [Schistocerca nitens]|uniref:ankyrin repeat domain-containing protein 65-like n=1 Tax=Schistocerca nitens TaxID=7011 RepID=UPI002117F0AB|nr:ankyrin repeat domain-containing protein 65-like [Schistocerca nitens]
MAILTTSITLEEVLKWSPLHFAEETGAWAWVERLLQAGVPSRDLSTTKKRLQCPEDAKDIMRRACEEGLVSVLQFALSVDRSLAGRPLDDRQTTPLHVAARHRRETALRCLLAAGADVDAVDTSGRAPLHEAVLTDSAHATRMLLDAGASATVKDGEGMSPKRLAEAHVCISALSVVSDFVQDEPWEQIAQFIMATETGCVERTRRSLVAVSRSDGPAFLQWSVLHWVAMSGSGTAIRTLVASGSDADARGATGETPLHGAAAWGSEAAVAALLECGASVDARDRSGSAPLHYAARTGNLAALRALLAAGADGDARDGDGNTALHHAAAAGAADTVAALLAAGASGRLRNRDGHTAYDMARARGFRNVLGLLYDKAARPPTSATTATEHLPG